MNKPIDTDSYIATFPADTQHKLQQMRAIIKQSAPQAEEVISYAMPAFKLNGMLVWFAGYTKHIGFYPGAAGIEKFKSEFGHYKSSKGAVQFPLDEPLPVDLITRIVEYNVVHNLEKLKTTKKNKGRVLPVMTFLLQL